MINRLKKIYSWLLRIRTKLFNNLFGDRNYKKFVIISQSRTGSTLLMALLNNHENIDCEGELFKKLNGKSCKQIWDSFFGKRPKRIKQVGFKLFYTHPNDSDQSVWDFIENDKELTIVHLVRNNYLRVLVSQKIGLKTKLWTENIHNPHNLTLEDKKITLDYQEAIDMFERVSGYEEKTRERFSGHKFVEVNYEDLARDSDKVVHEITSKLNLDYQKVFANNKKQNTESLEELILNYTEINSRFKDTKWEYLFKE